MKVVIVGAGIGGLTATIALRQAGYETTVLERADSARGVGAGILLQANALTALQTLGVAEDVLAAGAPVQSGRITTVEGRLIKELHWSAEQVAGVAIHRANLQEILLRHAGPSHVITGATLSDFVLSDYEVVARTESGNTFSADALIGADGIHSTVRAQHLQDGPPRYCGYTCWRGITSSPDAFKPGQVFEIWDAGKRFGGVHVDDERMYWFAPVNAVPGGRDTPGAVRETLLALYQGWPEAVLSTIASTPEEAILRNDIVDRPFSHDWGRGRMTLLGDAAHPMAPDQGQGACQAIEDAIVLARCIEAGGGIVEALRLYERKRRGRTRGFVVRSRMFGQVAQWENRIARWLRDAALRATPRFLVRRDIERSLRFTAE